MTAEQGIKLVNAIKLQMNSTEQTKFNKMILEQVEDRESKVQLCLAKLVSKHAKGQKLRFK